MNRAATTATPSNSAREIQPYPEQRRRADGTVLKAVLIGLAVDIGGSLLLGIVIGIGFALSTGLFELPRAEFEATILALPSNPWYLALDGVLGAGMTLVGGFVCGRIAGQAAIRAGVIFAAVGVVLGLLGSLAHPAWLNVLFSVVTVACTMIGVRFGAASRVQD